MVSVGEKIYNLIDSMLRGAEIDSAAREKTGWINHVLTIEGDPGLIAAIDVELARNTKKAVDGTKTDDKNQDAHVKAYGKFMQQNDPSNKKGMPYVKDALEFLSDPQGKFVKMATNMFKDLGRMLPVIGPLIVAAFAVPEISKQIIKITTSRGWYFDMTFRKNMDTLMNRLRPLEQQQSIRSGFTQVIFTSRAGTPYERDAYNTYVEVNNADKQSDLYWSIRDPYGVAVT